MPFLKSLYWLLYANHCSVIGIAGPESPQCVLPGGKADAFLSIILIPPPSQNPSKMTYYWWNDELPLCVLSLTITMTSPEQRASSMDGWGNVRGRRHGKESDPTPAVPGWYVTGPGVWQLMASPSWVQTREPNDAWWYSVSIETTEVAKVASVELMFRWCG